MIDKQSLLNEINFQIAEEEYDRDEPTNTNEDTEYRKGKIDALTEVKNYIEKGLWYF